MIAGMKPQSYPHVGTLNPKYQDWTRKNFFLCWRQPQWAAWLRLRTKIQNFEPGSFACSVRFLDRSPCPSIGFGVWGGNSEKVFLVLASTAVSGLAAAEDNNDSLKVAKETTEGSPRSGWGIRFGGRLVETAGVKMTQWHNHEIFNKSRLFRHFFQKYTFRYSK